MRTKGHVLFAAIGIVGILLGSCATAIGVSVKKPPLMPMSGVKSVGVAAFTYNSVAAGPLAAKLTNELVSKLNTANSELPAYEHIYSPIDVPNVGRQNIGALIEGRITKFESKDELVPGTRKDAKTGVQTRYTTYKRTLTAELSVRVSRGSGGALIGTKTFQASTSDSNEEAGKVKSVDSLTENLGFASAISEMVRSIAPYTNYERRVLMQDKSKNPKLKEADDLVKKKDYAGALETFLAVYQEIGVLSAGYNAAIMHEITGSLDEAIAFMGQVSSKFPASKEAQAELARMKKTKADMEAVEKSVK